MAGALSGVKETSSSRSDRSDLRRPAEPLELVACEAELAQDLLGVLAELRRIERLGTLHGERFHRQVRKRRAGTVGCEQPGEMPARDQVGMLEQVQGGIDRRVRDIGPLEDGEQLGKGQSPNLVGGSIREPLELFPPPGVGS